MPLQLEPLAPLDDLAALDRAVPLLNGAPLVIAIDLIDEDPGQPRTEFDDESLAELAATIAERGVKQPISVRPHPDQPGRWMLNFGARRLRASRLAGKTEIPAFVDDAADSYDQVIENEQREALTPLELALFVQRRMAVGDSQAEIAKRLGKTRGYLTFIGALINAPDWLLSLYRSGRCRGITELYDLRKLHEAEPDAVAQWLATQSGVTRSDVQALKDALKPLESTQQRQPETGKVIPQHDAELSVVERSRPANAVPSRALPVPVCAPADAATLWARYEGVEVMIDLGAVPEEDGCVFVRARGSDDRIPALASRLLLLRVTSA